MVYTPTGSELTRVVLMRVKSDRKILSYGRLKFSHKHARSEVMVLIQNFLFLRFISQLLLKLGFWNLTCFIDTNTIFPNWFYFFPNFKILDLK